MKRTSKQNNSIHLLFEEIARELNNSGIDMRVLIKNLQVSHTKKSVKGIWKAICEAKYGKKSTTELTSKEIDEVYDEFNRLLSEFGIHVAFPSNIFYIND